MAREPKKDALANWDEELAKQAAVAAGMEASTVSANFFSLRGGQLSFNDSPIPGNQMAVVVVDGILENVYYGQGYDPEDVQPPACFAFGRDDKGMHPHEVVKEPQHESCDGCPQNEWGSADKGRGKACANRRRLALIMAGKFNENTGKFEAITDPEHYESAQIAYLKLPVTSVKAYSAVVKQIAAALKRPPHGVFMKFKTVPDPKTQFKVMVEALAPVPANILPAIMKRHEEAKGVIEFAYQPREEGEAGGKGGKDKGGKGGKDKSKRKY